MALHEIPDGEAEHHVSTMDCPCRPSVKWTSRYALYGGWRPVIEHTALTAAELVPPAENVPPARGGLTL